MTPEEVEAFFLQIQARHAPKPPEEDIQAAIQTLSKSPVSEYPAFTEEQIRLIGAYRAYLSRGAYDPAWRTIVNAEPEAWAVAVHEWAELTAFAEMGANPFDWQDWQVHFEEAHLQALASELQYLQDWAMQQGLTLSPLALESENPIRRGTKEHPKFIGLLQARFGWKSPSSSELQSARTFWQNLLQGGIP